MNMILHKCLDSWGENFHEAAQAAEPVEEHRIDFACSDVSVQFKASHCAQLFSYFVGSLTVALSLLNSWIVHMKKNDGGWVWIIL